MFNQKFLIMRKVLIVVGLLFVTFNVNAQKENLSTLADSAVSLMEDGKMDESRSILEYIIISVH